MFSIIRIYSPKIDKDPIHNDMNHRISLDPIKLTSMADPTHAILQTDDEVSSTEATETI